MVSVSSSSAAMSLAVTSISTEPPLVASLESSTATGTLLTAAVGVGSGVATGERNPGVQLTRRVYADSFLHSMPT